MLMLTQGMVVDAILSNAKEQQKKISCVQYVVSKPNKMHKPQACWK